MTVTVVTDSAAALPPDLVAGYDIRVVPLVLNVGADRYRDGEISLDELVRRFDEPISTAAPSPGEFATVMADGLRSGPVVTLTLAAGMSSTHDSAKLAAKLVSDADPRAPADGGPDVAVLDTGTAAGAQALVVLAAARAAAEGADQYDVVATAERVAGRVRLAASVADLERLAASGRVPDAARWIGDRLGVRPLFEFRDGRARPLRPAFSADAALDRIVQRCAAGAGGGARLHVTVLHALNPDAAATLAERVQALSPASFLVGPFSPVMVAHTGRGLAGLAWWWE
ncbi:MAG TPA: DegV family protein [Acidimicrobiales bacterium]|jgi:DegV family protein with EDD domain|nr:DegV family protein [Acidimicrobiales bacterium]